ncbi:MULTISPECIES: RidA family protein [unclassified Mesorhizobium]|uniref:RidA family protein n=1 Tax=unclassified Mesorhizobium TaxID=325217 RepID=UPI001092C56D|nr:MULTISPECIES: RidA family protein [unclassified Mesorhizobium]TGU40073.1 RidA family protein [bacterium M00.F.Ca.ET.156.01.1.1]TGV15136.1 RidA family protein [Mesorhizobium sp. M8A.F.Ca.ET.173.01.1.1]TGQ77273.1 RidA family protein [Mesorhizobium sp. M8A.F.Ca.ET.207.01.1.1]TGQ89090.1 RidA family protein [Mesorhizobium sp. M8A.F.Ca.ET.208.01.1.1]TGR32195.1 RidA family protein [Mesorhizobium sp. M8A.F.Ca.ET.202.01.1.1]
MTEVGILPKGLGPFRIGRDTMPWSSGCVSGGFVFLSGIVGHVDDDGNPVPGLEEQTELAFARLISELERAGSSFDNLVRLNQYITNASEREPYVGRREAFLRSKVDKYPERRAFASTLLITTLADPAIRLELEATAAVGAK